MNNSTTEQVKIDIYSGEFLQKIQELHPNLILDAQLTKLSHEITHLIRSRKIHSFIEADEWVKNKVSMFKNLKTIFTVYNPENTTLSTDSFFFLKTDFSQITQNQRLNRIGISVLPLKSNKIIFAVIFAELEENSIAPKIKSIIKEFSGKIPNFESFSVNPFLQLVNSFRSAFQLPAVSLNETQYENKESDNENEFVTLNIPIPKNQDILLSCLLNPSFVQLIFSPIESFYVKPDFYQDSDKSSILIQSKRIRNIQNEQPINTNTNTPNNVNTKQPTIEKQPTEQQKNEIEENEKQKEEQIEKKEDQIEAKEEEIEQEINQIESEEEPEITEEEEDKEPTTESTKEKEIDQKIKQIDQEVNQIESEEEPEITEEEEDKGPTTESTKEKEIDQKIKQIDQEVNQIEQETKQIEQDIAQEEKAEASHEREIESKEKEIEQKIENIEQKVSQEEQAETKEDQMNEIQTEQNESKEEETNQKVDQTIEQGEPQNEQTEAAKIEQIEAKEEEIDRKVDQINDKVIAEEIKAEEIQEKVIDQEVERIEQAVAQEEQKEAAQEQEIESKEKEIDQKVEQIEQKVEQKESTEEPENTKYEEKDKGPTTEPANENENDQTEAAKLEEIERKEKEIDQKVDQIEQKVEAEEAQEQEIESKEKEIDQKVEQINAKVEAEEAQEQKIDQEVGRIEQAVAQEEQKEAAQEQEIDQKVEQIEQKVDQKESTEETENTKYEEKDKGPTAEPAKEEQPYSDSTTTSQTKPTDEPSNQASTSTEKHIFLDKTPKSATTKPEEEISAPTKIKSILTTPKKENQSNSTGFLDESQLNDTSNNNKDNDNNDKDNEESKEPAKIINLNDPCRDTNDCIERAIQVYNTTYNICSTEKPIQEMSDKLLHFMEEHKDDYNKAVTKITVKKLFDNDITEYKKGFSFNNMNWKDIQKQIEKLPPGYHYNPEHNKENIIFAIASVISDDSNPDDVKFNFSYVTRQVEINPQIRRNLSQVGYLTPNPKSTTTTSTIDRTPIKQIASFSFQNISKTPNPNQQETPDSSKSSTTSVPSRYSEESQRIEFEIGNILRSLKKTTQLPLSTELSDRLRKTLAENRGRVWTNPEINELFSGDLDYVWARTFVKLKKDEIIKRAKHQYKDMFKNKITTAGTFVIAAIREDENQDTYTAVVISGSAKTNTNNTNNNNNSNDNNNNNDNNNQSTPVSNLNLKDVKKGSATSSNASFGNMSGASSGSATPRGSARKRGPKREIGDFERSRLFLEKFNTYRKSVGKGPLELNVALIEPAKRLSKIIMTSFSIVNPQPFIKEAYQVPGVENVMVCATFDSKKSDYVTRCFDKMLAKSKDVIESDNDKIAIAYWNDENQNVSVACFLFHMRQ